MPEITHKSSEKNTQPKNSRSVELEERNDIAKHLKSV